MFDIGQKLVMFERSKDSPSNKFIQQYEIASVVEQKAQFKFTMTNGDTVCVAKKDEADKTYWFDVRKVVSGATNEAITPNVYCKFYIVPAEASQAQVILQLGTLHQFSENNGFFYRNKSLLFKLVKDNPDLYKKVEQVNSQLEALKNELLAASNKKG